MLVRLRCCAMGIVMGTCLMAALTLESLVMRGRTRLCGPNDRPDWLSKDD